MIEGKGRTILKWLPAMCWMLLIFMLSNQPGSDSSRLSELMMSMLHDLGLDLPLVFGKYATFVLRKLAHFTEYFILFLLLRMALARMSKRDLWAFLIAILYAASDEFHQLFIPGRVGNFGDILVDSFGAAVGWILVWFRSRNKRMRSHP